MSPLRPHHPSRASFVAALALALLVACDAPPADESSGTGAGAASDAATGPERDDTPPADTSFERIELDTGALERSGGIDIEVGANALSLLFTAALEDETFGLGITRVVAPDDTVVHRTVFEDDSWEAVRFESDVVAEPVVGSGDVALFVPSSSGRGLAPGTWRVELELDPPDARVVHASAVVRIAPGGTDPDLVTHAVDVHVHVIHRDPRRRGAGFATELDTEWRAALDRVLDPHALAIGTLTHTVSPPRETARLAELDDEREIAEACRAIRRSAPGDGATPVLHVGLVGTITGDGAADYTLDYRDDREDGDGTDGTGEPGGEWASDAGEAGGEDDGSLTGLSPQPGLPFDRASSNACVFIAEDPWRESGAGGAPLDEDTVTELLAANLLHELGHFAGLAHPSEADGRTFDLLEDTPRCTSPDVETCGIAGGAGNLMFHSGDERTLPWTLTPDQARVLRVHPLFRPIDGTTRRASSGEPELQ